MSPECCAVPMHRVVDAAPEVRGEVEKEEVLEAPTRRGPSVVAVVLLLGVLLAVLAALLWHREAHGHHSGGGAPLHLRLQSVLSALAPMPLHLRPVQHRATLLGVLLAPPRPPPRVGPDRRGGHVAVAVQRCASAAGLRPPPRRVVRETLRDGSGAAVLSWLAFEVPPSAPEQQQQQQPMWVAEARAVATLAAFAKHLGASTMVDVAAGDGRAALAMAAAGVTVIAAADDPHEAALLRAAACVNRAVSSSGAAAATVHVVTAAAAEMLTPEPTRCTVTAGDAAYRCIRNPGPQSGAADADAAATAVMGPVLRRALTGGAPDAAAAAALSAAATFLRLRGDTVLQDGATLLEFVVGARAWLLSAAARPRVIVISLTAAAAASGPEARAALQSQLALLPHAHRALNGTYHAFSFGAAAAAAAAGWIASVDAYAEAALAEVQQSGGGWSDVFVWVADSERSAFSAAFAASVRPQ